MENTQMAMSALAKRDQEFKEKIREELREEIWLETMLEVAGNCLKNGVSLEIVLKSTGLTLEQLLAVGIVIPKEQ